MYWKLAIQNIRRSLRDYIIYFVTLTFTALCDVLLFRDELFYYESFGLFAVLILVQLAATGVAKRFIFIKKKKKIE
ncbi:MAG: permease [Faecalibacterium sp.]